MSLLGMGSLKGGFYGGSIFGVRGSFGGYGNIFFGFIQWKPLNVIMVNVISHLL
jgi:hypothetical protein